MGAEDMSNNVAVYEADDVFFSDSEATSSVIYVLNGVRKAPYMISQDMREHYDYLINTVDPVKRMDPDEEALLVAALKALAEAVSKIDINFHGSLLSNIFGLSIWNYGLDARDAILKLVICLASVPDKFLDDCLNMLVNNFRPPISHRDPRCLRKKNEVHSQLHATLHSITFLVPLAPVKLRDVIDRRMPRHTDSKEDIVVFVECMLGLGSDEIGEFLRSTLLPKVVDLLTDLDVNISWEEILQEDHSKGIFDMELEDGHEDADTVEKLGTKPTQETVAVLKGNVFAKKLDGLMVVMCEHLKTCACDGLLGMAFETLMDSFRKTVLNAYKSKFAQFLMFYACSLDPEKCGKIFADLLTDIYVSKFEDPNSRMSAVGYLASYLSRARFISSYLVANKLKRLVDWCFEYCQFQNGREISINPAAHRIYYSGCQAVMYIMCFRMRSMMDIPELKSLLIHLPLEHILSHPLDPLKVCLPTIVHEFMRQASTAHLFNTSTTFTYDSILLESSLSKAFGGLERLDMFFPFDPYLLKESDRYMRPNYEFWYLVKTTYNDFSSEDEDEDLDGPYNADGADIRNFEENESEGDDDLECSMDKMSITPKLPIHNPAQMPARLRPSVSPPNW